MLSWLCALLLLTPPQRPEPHELSRFAPLDTQSVDYYKGLQGPAFGKAVTLFEEGKYKEAASAFSALHEATGDPAALVLAGNCYYQLDQADLAIETYTRAIQKGLDEMPDVHSNLGMAYYAKSLKKEAIRAFRRALELTGDNDAIAHYGLGILMDGERRHEESIRHYRKTIELTRDTEPLARQHLGLAYFMNRQYPEAVEHLRVYVRQVPADPGGYLNLGIALRFLGDLDGAIEQLQLAIDRSQDKLPPAHYELAAIYAVREQYALSLQHFEIAIDRGQNSPKIQAEYEAVKRKQQ
jgi:tetratricopeptide (TPR) repeat protein